MASPQNNNRRSRQIGARLALCLLQTILWAVFAQGASLASLGSARVSITAATAPPVVQGVNAKGSNERARDVVLTLVPRLSLPTSNLFVIHAAPGQRYLVETDPRFTNQQAFLSSDYFLTQLLGDPERNLKRLGDGFYEQQLVNDAILALTGRRYLDGYSSTEAEYQGLMNAGVAFARDYQLTPGVALSADQMASLTTDIVWLTTQTVTLADGTTQQVLVPQVYLRRPQSGDLQDSGALISGSSITLTSTQAITNSGTIQTTGSAQINAGSDFVNAGGTLRGQDVLVQAGNDLKNLGGTLQANGQLALLAGRDIVLQTTTQTNSIETATNTASRTNIDRVAVVTGESLALVAGRDISIAGASLSATGTATDANPTGGNLIASAGRDLTITTVGEHYELSIARGGNYDGRTAYSNEASSTNHAAQISAAQDLTLIAQGDLNMTGANASAGRDALLQGANVIIAAAKDSASADVQNVGKNSFSHAQSSEETAVGGSLTSGGNMTLTATAGDIHLTGASLTATDGGINLTASRDVMLDALALASSALTEHKDSSRGLVSSETNESQHARAETQAQGSALSGSEIFIASGRDVALNAATLVADKTLAIDAARNVTLGVANESFAQSDQESQRTSGMFTSGAGITFGSKQLDQSADQTQTSERTSTLASLGGDISIHAGGDYRQIGGTLVTGQADASGHLVGGGDIGIDARSIDITEARTHNATNEAFKFHQGGLSVGVKSPILDLIQGAQSLDQAANQTSDPRMKALAGATAVLETARGLEGIAKDASAGQTPDASVRIAISLGSNRSSNETHTTESSAQGATLAAGGKLTLNAHGAGAASTLHARGAQIGAAGDATLAAEGDLQLSAAQNDATYAQSNKSQSASIGVSFGVGQKTGWSIDVAAAAARGNADGQATSWSPSSVEAGGTLTLVSGGDMLLAGTQARGERVEAHVGHNLTIESLKDATDYTSQQANAGFTASIGFSTASGGSFSASKSKLDAHAHGVTDQAGLFAGSGGFDIDVGGQTTLTGGVIASHAEAEKNHLTTATLVTQDMSNDASIRASSTGISGSSSGTGLSPGISYASKNTNEHTSTHSAIGAGSITIRDEAAQQALTGQDAQTTVANLDRNTADAHTQLSGAYDTASLQKTEREVSANATIMQRASSAGFKEAGAYAQGQVDEANAKERAATEYRNQAQEARANGDTDRAASLNAYADQLASDAASQHAIWDEGGAGRIALHTAVGALTGGGAGALGAAANQSAQPTLEAATAGIENDTLRNMVREAASTVIGAVVGGGTGAATALAADVNNRQLHPSQLQAIKDKAKQLDGQGFKTAAQWEAELTKQALYENDSGFASLGNNPTAEAILAQIARTGGPRMDYRNDPSYTNPVAGAENLANLGVVGGYVNAGVSGATIDRIYANRNIDNGTISAPGLPDTFHYNAANSLQDEILNAGGGLIIGKGLSVIGKIGGEIGEALGVGGKAAETGRGGLVTAEGTANGATYPLLKNQLAAENLANIAAQDARLAKAIAGDAGIGSGSVAEADKLGRIWVGDGAKLVDNQASCPGCLKSADGLRIYRPPMEKNAPAIWNPTGVQANFVQLGSDGKTIISNGHLVVLP